jgi:hypothetical protein
MNYLLLRSLTLIPLTWPRCIHVLVCLGMPWRLNCKQKMKICASMKLHLWAGLPYFLTCNCMKLDCVWQIDRWLHSQILYVLWTRKVHDRVHNSPPCAGLYGSHPAVEVKFDTSCMEDSIKCACAELITCDAVQCRHSSISSRKRSTAARFTCYGDQVSAVWRQCAVFVLLGDGFCLLLFVFLVYCTYVSVCL